ncbi:PucR family transcriptional regulator [Amycolatopsis jejuensis]|uniref:PucR family transcriptional regulator n=1 Tax=Amycolatopsis jejuensis TaxID=330084 RepID=UPI0005267CC5|nr:helix-turn-helix domain-containing protein [Amycolatopsis jejuensis]
MTSVATQPPILRELAACLLDRVPELTDRLHEVLLAKDDTYRTTAAVTPAELTRSLHDNLTRCTQFLADRVPPGVDFRDAARHTARQRAQAGFPLESLLHAYRLGTEVLWAALVEQARSRRPESIGELLDSAVLVLELIDTMSQTASAEYRVQETAAMRRSIERRQAMLDGLLDGRGADPEVAIEAGTLLELPADGRFVVAVVRRDTASAAPPWPPRDALAVHGFRSEWCPRSDQDVGLVLLGDAPVERLTARLRAVVDRPAGVSAEVAGLAEVASAFRMAQLASDTVPAQQPQVVAFEERLPEVLLAANPAVAQQIRRRAFGALPSLAGDKQAVLVDTLRSWFRHDGSAAEVAAELHCHRNTVLHRIARIEQLTGRSVADERDGLLLRLALLVP